MKNEKEKKKRKEKERYPSGTNSTRSDHLLSSKAGEKNVTLKF